MEDRALDIKKDITTLVTETILVASGLCFIVSVYSIFQFGNFILLFLAKGLYVIGSILFIFKK